MSPNPGNNTAMLSLFHILWKHYEKLYVQGFKTIQK